MLDLHDKRGGHELIIKGMTLIPSTCIHQNFVKLLLTWASEYLLQVPLPPLSLCRSRPFKANRVLLPTTSRTLNEFNFDEFLHQHYPNQSLIMEDWLHGQKRFEQNDGAEDNGLSL